MKAASMFVFLIAAQAAAAAEKPDEAGVRDAENRWSEAFVSGDAATLDALLDADYVSTGANGKPRAKAEIIGLASAYRLIRREEAMARHARAPALAPTSSVVASGNPP